MPRQIDMSSQPKTVGARTTMYHVIRLDSTYFNGTNQTWNGSWLGWLRTRTYVHEIHLVGVLVKRWGGDNHVKECF